MVRGLLMGVCALVVSAAVVAVVAFPSMAATACPGCYGLERVAPSLYVERGLPAERRATILATLEQARHRVAEFYGGRRSSPRILACGTQECYRRIGGGQERGVAVLNRAVMLSPRGLNQVIAAHELSHVELHERLGPAAGKVPRWFDEGLAAVVSDDRRYLRTASERRPDRCRIRSDEALPETLSDWLGGASEGGQRLYAVSACRVSRWLDDQGGRQGLLALVDRLRAGEEFPPVRP